MNESNKSENPAEFGEKSALITYARREWERERKIFDALQEKITVSRRKLEKLAILLDENFETESPASVTIKRVPSGKINEIKQNLLKEPGEFYLKTVWENNFQEIIKYPNFYHHFMRWVGRDFERVHNGVYRVKKPLDNIPPES